MKQLKPNKKAYYLLGLMLFLCIGLCVLSVGTTFARFRDEREQGVLFQVREPERILLGTVKDEVFTQADNLEWVIEDGVAQLTFAVANGVSGESYSTRDQLVRLCMVGSLGIAKDGVIPELSVTFVPQRGNSEERTVIAKASPIVEGTALYHSFGSGWLYSFYETTVEGERELTWELSGGKLSYIVLTVKTDSTISDHAKLLQPLVSAEAIGN